MKIEVKHSKERDLYDKLLYIATNLKKVRSGKLNKIKKITEYYKNNIILGLSCAILFAIIYLCTKHVLYLVGFILLVVLSVILIFITKSVNTDIDAFVNNNEDSIIEIDKDGINLSKKNLDVLLKWDDMSLIIVNADLICFIPKEDTDLMISVSSKYRDDLLKGIKKYKKEKLIRNI